MEPGVVTIGHSTHSIEEFLALLRGAGVTDVLDVRTLAGSRHNPQFNSEDLAASLAEAGIVYLRDERLGGLRSKSPGIDPSVNALWENKSFHRYADYTLTAPFSAGLAALVKLAQPPRRVAIMCAEAVWWRCHRRIIADYLLAQGVAVAHLMPDGRLVEATLTRGARVVGARVEYPAEATNPAESP